MSFNKQVIAATVAAYGEGAKEFIQLTLSDADIFMAERRVDGNNIGKFCVPPMRKSEIIF